LRLPVTISNHFLTVHSPPKFEYQNQQRQQQIPYLIIVLPINKVNKSKTLNEKLGIFKKELQNPSKNSNNLDTMKGWFFNGVSEDRSAKMKGTANASPPVSDLKFRKRLNLTGKSPVDLEGRNRDNMIKALENMETNGFIDNNFIVLIIGSVRSCPSQNDGKLRSFV
jgi:hypothetical protein